MVEKDLAEGKNKGRVQTRFLPEPNGYLHIGHAKAICLDFGIAQKYGGVCNLRFDDTNPVKEDLEYVDAIKEDIEWLGYHWNNIYYASDYFQQLWDFAIQLIKEEKHTSTSRLPNRSPPRRGHRHNREQTVPTVTARSKRTWSCSTR